MRYILFIFVALLSNVAFGQKTPQLPVFISQCVVKGTKGNAYVNTKKNFAHFFAIALSFDSKGKIDTLYYSSKLNPETKKIFALDTSFLKKIKTYNFNFKEYASKTVLFSYYCYNATDDSVEYKNGFLNSIGDFIPEAIHEKPVIVLKPIIDAGLPSAHGNIK
ncbi:hypothetical protein EZ456_21455 [Pedobacter psychrodurus]|uniref:Uncharacterized protein n=1 Tax=Pedobacter psychrodurus TaxID=2530456 RepID=A0A4R0PJH9_9SPHI|nr:hypothetical protein [Pedobacter psychrodurus]TCD18276.1 hypothetical protein EZ456_21455 [Pedobacter psychrodurus]